MGMERDNHNGVEGKDIYRTLVSELMIDTKATEKKLETLFLSKRYQEDYEYRVVLETVKVSLLYIQGKPGEMIPLASDLIERGRDLGLWYLVAMNQNSLGIAYQMLEMLERALESYKATIETEKEHGLLFASPLAYNNIALMYINLKAYEKAFSNMICAIDLETEVEREKKLRNVKLATYKSHLVIVLCHMKRLEEAKAILGEIEATYEDIAESESVYYYELARLHYAFSTEDYNRGKEIFHHIKRSAGSKNKIWLKSVFSEYFMLCEKMGLHSRFYAEELREVSRLQEEDREMGDISIYKSLWKYYKEMGDEENLEKITLRYMKELEKNNEYVRNRQLVSLSLVESLIDESRKLSKV